MTRYSPRVQSSIPILFVVKLNINIPGLILGLCPAYERRRNFVTTSLVGWAQASHYNRSCYREVPLHHDDVIKWKHFPRYWPFVRGIHRSPVNSPHKGQWRGALMFTLICVWINGCVNNREAGDLRRYCAHYGVTVMTNKIKHWMYSFTRCIWKFTHFWSWTL